MNIDFHAPANRYSYAGREVQPDWAALVRSLVDPAAKRVADIGCGGGLYSAAWADLGAVEVTGVDFSAGMVRTATERNRGRSNIAFKQGDALATGLPSESADIDLVRYEDVAKLNLQFQQVRRIFSASMAMFLQHCQHNARRLCLRAFFVVHEWSTQRFFWTLISARGGAWWHSSSGGDCAVGSRP